MPSALLYECFSGLAGDMHLGALLDLGLPEEHLREELGKLQLDQEFTLHIRREKKQGISGTQVHVELLSERSPYRHLSEIESLLENSGLSPQVKTRTLSMFQLLGRAEAQVHDISIEKVHFHEVGAVDAIVDMTSAAIGLEYFNVEEIYCHGVELGSGFVKCQHGLMPVPAPATALLLQGKLTTRGNIQGEATTPTGATILSHAVTHWSNPLSFTAKRTSYGIGHKDFVRPNVIRLTLGETDVNLEVDANICIECNIDDMSAEAFEPLTERLFEIGAKDVFTTPITMKKSRPGVKLTALVSDSLSERVTECILTHTTTIGVRSYPVTKKMLPRRSQILDTPLGQVNVKIVTLPNGSERWKIEHEDVKRISNSEQIDYLSTRMQLDQYVTQKLDSIDNG